MGLSSAPASIIVFIEEHMHINHNFGTIIIFFSSFLSTVNTELIDRFISSENILFYISMNFIAIIISLIMFSLILCSKQFLKHSGSFTLNVEQNDRKVDFDINSENELSINSYTLRETSIVSIN